MRARLLLLVVASSWALSASTARALPWYEQGDAGASDDPQVTQGVGSLTEIHGLIGTPGTGDPDAIDAFLFGYGGAAGVLGITASFDDPQVGAIGLRLFDALGGVLVDLTEQASVTDLPAGSYILEVLVDDDAGDPPYTVRFDAPASGASGVVFAEPLPEPGAAALLASAALAFAVISAAR
jgi:hypothetical protein